VAPIFYELADVLLSRVDRESESRGALLAEARDVIEQLKAAELEDYFQDDCGDLINAKRKNIEGYLDKAAVVYVIPLPDRTELLLSLPNHAGPVRVSPSRVTGAELERTARQFRSELDDTLAFDFKPSARKLYDWLIAPIDPILRENGIDTLIFVPDGELRAIPMGALFDGEHFLVERYACAISPGLSLLEPRPLPTNARVLAAGLSKGAEGFGDLPYVPQELAQISSLFPAERLQDDTFQKQRFDSEFRQQPFTIVHIASHGKFERDIDKTFILTADGKLNLRELERVIQPSQFRGTPVELLALSACETARGDDAARASLGLAGVAIKAGARSAIATLWCVDDEASSYLIGQFYEALKNNPGISKAKALQAAQLKLIAQRRYKHPGYWAPYQIIGNWL
jgi:CHAT domain-containing protein